MRHLTPGVSVYGMRSLHGTDDARMIYGNSELLATLAGLYAKEVMDLAEVAEPLILGGNCQGAWVAHAIARQLLGCGVNVGRLILMEMRLEMLEQKLIGWDGPVALIWGADSVHNPFSRAYRPSSKRLRLLRRIAPLVYRSLIRLRLQQTFKGGFEISIVPGVHGEFFRSQNIEGLADAIGGAC